MKSYLNLGLSTEEVKKRIKEGKVNKSKNVVYKSHLRIIYESFFSFFNIILYLVGLTFLIIQLNFDNGIKEIPLTKYGFLLVILINGLFSLVVEERSKYLIEKMEINEKDKSSKILVIRDNKEVYVKEDEIVIDDIVILKKDEINLLKYTFPLDFIFIEGEITVNESILTGESNPIQKEINDTILSGSSIFSYLNSEYVVLKVKEVGKNTYIKKLEYSVKKKKANKSKLFKDINKIILFMVIIMIPSFIITLINELVANNFTFSISIISNTSTIIVGMIPIGLVLLASISLSSSIFKLYKINVMSKELYSIETLARCDTLVLDKTGTITTNKIIMKESIIINNYLKENNEIYIKLVLDYLNLFNDNETSISVKEYFNNESKKFPRGNFSTLKNENIPYILNKEEIKEVNYFDSNKKYSSLILNNGDTYYLGASEKLNIKDEAILSKINNYSKNGLRVLVFKRNDDVLGIFILQNELRKGIKEIIEYFKNELKMDIKIITGDNLLTVNALAKEASIEYNSSISLENINSNEDNFIDIALNNDIFARANPHDKERIIDILESNNHKCCYIGDGVNDILSLNRASSSVALASGCKASKLISDFTLLDDDFIHLKEVIKEGRRSINNINRSTILFIAKDIYFFFLSLISLITMKGLIVGIESIYIFNFITIALSGFLLSIENKNYDRVIDNFVKYSLKKGTLAGVFIALSSALALLITTLNGSSNGPLLISILISISGPVIIFNISYPLSKYNYVVIAINIFFTLLFMFGFPNVFLDPSYLKQGSTVAEQINLIFGCFFNFDFFKQLDFIKDWLTLLMSFVVATIIYTFLNMTLIKNNGYLFKKRDK